MSASSSQRLKGILTVTVLKAKNLPKGDLFGDNDCYTVISTEPISSETKIGTETCQKTQIHDGTNPIFDEKFVFPVPNRLDALYCQIWDDDHGKDELLGSGSLDLLDDNLGGRYDTELSKEWLHTATIPLVSEKGKNAGTLELILHFIPESTADYLGKKFNAAQAELKKQITQTIVSKVTDVATDKIRASVGIGETS